MDSQANNQTEISPWKQDFFSMFGFGEKPIEPTVMMKEPSAPRPVGDSIFKQILGIKSPPPFKMPYQEPSKTDDSFDAVFDKLIQAESSGRHTKADGSLLEGPKTASGDKAKGITQLMPKTAGDPGYGVKPLQNDSQEEYIRFGKDLLKAYTKEFGGDIRKGLAAYNWGIGNMKKAVAKNGENWESKAPPETKKYLQNILGQTSYIKGADDAGGKVTQLKPTLDSLRAENSEFQAITTFLEGIGGAPAIEVGDTEGDAEFTVFGSKDNGRITVNERFLKSPDLKNAIVHEYTHAAVNKLSDIYMRLNKAGASQNPAEEQFLDAYKKLQRTQWGKGSVKELAQRIAQEWTSTSGSYRTSEGELLAFGVGNSSEPLKGRRRKAMLNAPEHVDTSIATEFMILLDLAQRINKGK